MDAPTCERELRARGVHFEKAPEQRGVLLPVRLTAPVRGVTYRTALAERARKTSPYEITDCRLALALDDFAKILSAHDIVEVIHYSMYRPPSPRSLAPGALGTRHSGALAIDAGSFIKKDGSKIDVEKDFHGGIGQRACGVTPPTDPRAKELREIVCGAASAHLFNVALTPDYNWQHRNHFHLEVTAGRPHAEGELVHHPLSFAGAFRLVTRRCPSITGSPTIHQLAPVSLSLRSNSPRHSKRRCVPV